MTTPTGSVPGRIFMSYRHDDTAYPAAWLYKLLTSRFGNTQVFRVVPVLVEGARMPRADELPASLAVLTRRQALELSPNRFDTASERLIGALELT
jgi:hypothetical protein